MKKEEALYLYNKIKSASHYTTSMMFVGFAILSIAFSFTTGFIFNLAGVIFLIYSLIFIGLSLVEFKDGDKENLYSKVYFLKSGWKFEFEPYEEIMYLRGIGEIEKKLNERAKIILENIKEKKK